MYIVVLGSFPSSAATCGGCEFSTRLGLCSFTASETVLVKDFKPGPKLYIVDGSRSYDFRYVRSVYICCYSDAFGCWITQNNNIIGVISLMTGKKVFLVSITLCLSNSKTFVSKFG